MTLPRNNNGGDDDDQKSTNPPLEPGELQVPPGVGPILGSEHEAEENSKML